jgi:hypothetical protein
MTTEGNNRIMIFGPKEDGTYVVEFRTAGGEVMAISIPRTETAVIRHFPFREPPSTDFSSRLLKNSKIGRRCATFESKSPMRRLFCASRNRPLNQCCASRPPKNQFQQPARLS